MRRPTRPRAVAAAGLAGAGLLAALLLRFRRGGAAPAGAPAALPAGDGLAAAVPGPAPMPPMLPGGPARTRLLLPARLLIAAAVVIAWLVAAHLLWRSSVPADLHPPRLDPHRFFGARELGAAAGYARFGYAMDVASTLALVGALCAYARFGGRFARDSAAGPIGTGMYLAMMGFAIVWLAQLPFGLAQLWWDRRHHVAHTGYAGWIVDGWLGLGGEFLFVCLAIAIVMGLARLLGACWWIPAWPAFVGLALLFAFLTPYLTPNLHGLHDGAVAREAQRLARSEHVAGVPVRVQDVDASTSSPNAEAVGLGPSRTVILWNTLLDGRFDRREVGVVLAHELAHQSHDHIWKDVGWYALFALPGVFLLAAATRRRGALRTPAAVPLLLLVLVVLQLAAQPFQNLVSRRLEAEADWAALQTTHDPAAARSLFVKLSRTILAEPDEPTLAYVMLDNHPTIMQRIAMVQAWQRRRAR